MSNLPNKPTSPSPTPVDRRFFDLLLIFWIGFIILSLFFGNVSKTIPYSQFLSELDKGTLSNIVISNTQISGTLSEGKQKSEPFVTVRVDPVLAEKLERTRITFSGAQSDGFWTSILWWAVGIFIFLTVMQYIGRNAAGGAGALSPFSVEHNKARIYSEENIKVTFADVAGVDEAKAELQEVVQFLKSPQEYNRLGGRLPKGILLVGPPGTGKTLLARAVAGEAGVPFFSISGSEFVELFVGVGAARVRDLFAEARQKAPCIIFIDELDALGRSRSINPIATHDEKEQTLNQLLVEMDGFDTRAGVVLLAATNRPEILDQALLRAGRFDRHVLVDRPDKKGRVEILRVHLKNVIASKDLDLEAIAALTAGFTGADLANVVNEAALLASRNKEECVRQSDFDMAIERTIAGLEKKSRILSAVERTLVAHHEMGHALVAMCLPSTDAVQKVSIIPHGIAALGYTVQRPLEDRFILSRTELQNKLAALLGGRAAELLIYKEASTGAADDLAKATELARAMITRYGMDPQLGLAVYDSEPSAYLQTPLESQMHSGTSPETARQIDRAVKLMLDEAMKRALQLLTENRGWLEAAAARLIQDETLSSDQIRDLKPGQARASSTSLTAGTVKIDPRVDAPCLPIQNNGSAMPEVDEHDVLEHA